MYPNWSDHLNIPTVEDTVHIKYVLTVESPPNRHAGSKILIAPRKGKPEHSVRASAISDLLVVTHEMTTELVGELISLQGEPLPQTRVRLKNLLENHRSGLEYIAHYLAEKCIPPVSSKKVLFPVAAENDVSSKFEQNMSKWFPNLKVAEPAAYAEIMRVQNFSGEQWLSRLAQLTNFNKHNALSELEWSDFESYLVGEGDACLRFGELGFSAVEVEPGGALRFVNSGEVACEINGPDALDPKTLEGRLDGRIVRKEKRRMLRIRDSGHSLAHEIWVISKNVYRFIDKICSSLT